MEHLKLDPVKDVLSNFIAVQEERAKAYASFEEGFRRHQLEASNDRLYQVLAEKTTQTFKSASGRVRELESELRNMQRTDIADLIRAVQNAEREKVHLTVALQGLRKADAVRVAAEKDAPLLPHPSTGPGCACGTEHDSVSATASDIQSALAETTRALQDTVLSINDTLEEIRYLLLEDDDGATA
eukprot:jgi/Botrbrau1/13827/Bobra.0056s0069.1